MIRRCFRGSIPILLFLVFGVSAARGADPYGTSGGSMDQDPSFFPGGGFGQGGMPYQQVPGYPGSYPLGSAPNYNMLGEDFELGTAAERERTFAAPSPLPPEGQSAFEQFVSGKIEITKAQLEVIVNDPAITFTNFLGGTPPGAVVVPVSIVPSNGNGAGKAPSVSPDNVGMTPQAQAGMSVRSAAGAGYLVGPRDRIADAFRLLGIASPYSVSMDLKHFGLDLFQQSRYGFLTSSTLPVGPGYVLGPGDELKIRVWGKVEGSWIRRIDRDGTVRLPKVGVISLGGLTFAQAQESIHKEFSRVFSGFESNITLGSLRTMTVYVVGHARQPGAYTVSSMSTLVSALIQAGGPSKGGSLRDIQIRREGMTISRYDMYDLLRYGDKSGDPRLLPEDVIYIPPIGPVAAIAGSVNRPALYELKGERTASQLIELAGGLNALAFHGRLQIERIVENNRQIVFESDLAEWKEKEVDLRSGDILKVYQVVKDRRTVRILGAVHRDGEYGYTPGMKLKDLISLSGGTKYYAYMKEAELSRQHLSEAGPRVEKVGIDLGKAMAGDPAANLPLQENDQIFVRSIPEWNVYTQVTLLGEVRFPGVYTARKGERLSSVIERAGGFTSNAYPRGAVFTRATIRESQQKVLDESIARLEKDLLIQAASAAGVAASGQELGAIEVEVRRVESLVEKLKSIRAQGRMVLDISSPESLKNTLNDVELENGDLLVVPQNPRCIHTIGAVFNQATFVYDTRKNMDNYVMMAGGYTESADKDRLYILKVNGSAVRPESGGFFLFSGGLFSSNGESHLEPGDTIVVPEQLSRIAWLRNSKDIFQILFQATMAAGVVIAAL